MNEEHFPSVEETMRDVPPHTARSDAHDGGARRRQNPADPRSLVSPETPSSGVLQTMRNRSARSTPSDEGNGTTPRPPTEYTPPLIALFRDVPADGEEDDGDTIFSQPEPPSGHGNYSLRMELLDRSLRFLVSWLLTVPTIARLIENEKCHLDIGILDMLITLMIQHIGGDPTNVTMSDLRTLARWRSKDYAVALGSSLDNFTRSSLVEIAIALRYGYLQLELPYPGGNDRKYKDNE